MENSSLCLLPWVHLEIQPDGKVLTCCKAQGYPEMGNLHHNKLVEIWNETPIKNIRRSMLAGEEISQCRACKTQELSGAVSDRQLSFLQYPETLESLKETQLDGTFSDFEIRYLGLRFSNVCNLSCRMCEPYYSTSWFDNQHFLNYPAQTVKLLESTKSFDHLWSEIYPILRSLKKIYFAGGEPLLASQHYHFLEKLIELGRVDIEIIYNTNLTQLTLGNKDVLYLWNQFKHVSVAASIDAIGDRGEYIRQGSQWSIILENIIRLKSQAPHVLFTLYPTVQALNALHLVDLLEYFLDHFDLSPLDIHLNVLEYPHEQSVQILTKSIKELLSQKVTLFLKKKIFPHYSLSEYVYLHKELQAFVNFTKKEDMSHLQIDFKNFHDRLDSQVNKSLDIIFPELKTLFKT